MGFSHTRRRSRARQTAAGDAVSRATERYALTVMRGTSPPRSDRNNAEQAENFRAAQERTALRTSQVRRALAEHDVPPIQLVSYRNFGLHVDKLVRQYSDETLGVLVTQAISRWMRCGLSESVLKALCLRVFGLTL